MSNRHIKKLKYEFRQGSRYGIDAQTVGEELKSIQAKHGVLEPQVVVNESTPEDAPLHPVFEWDNDKAANSFRLHQSRKLIRSVCVIREAGKPSETVYAHVPSVTEGNVPSGYQPIEVVVSRPDMYAAALGALTTKFQAAKTALDELRHAAASAPDTDKERMARIEIAVQAMQTASAAVHALH